MKFSLPIVIAAAACADTAAALHIEFHSTRFCNSTVLRCVDWPRDTCCDPRASRQSLGFINLDRSRDWELRGYDRGGCSHRSATNASLGRGSVCLDRNPPYTGAGWGNFNLNREAQDGASLPVDLPVECGRPQEMEFIDGTRFNLTSLTDADYDMM
jgi:hypothetical protein